MAGYLVQFLPGVPVFNKPIWGETLNSKMWNLASRS